MAFLGPAELSSSARFQNYLGKYISRSLHVRARASGFAGRCDAESGLIELVVEKKCYDDVK